MPAQDIHDLVARYRADFEMDALKVSAAVNLLLKMLSLCAVKQHALAHRRSSMRAGGASIW